MSPFQIFALACMVVCALLLASGTKTSSTVQHHLGNWVIGALIGLGLALGLVGAFTIVAGITELVYRFLGWL